MAGAKKEAKASIPQKIKPTTERNFPHLAASFKKFCERGESCKSLLSRSEFSILQQLFKTLRLEF
jgi:hypothetical protein